MKIAFKKSFLKKFEKLDVHIQTKVTQKISIFQLNPFQKDLNNHALV
jgi:mRNA-degrading endonuclease RelE of RelBE toxin-antitoxin system